MQIEKVTDITRTETPVSKATEKSGAFENTMAQARNANKIVCTDIKISESGNIMVLSEGEWIEIDNEPLGEYDISYLDDGTVFQLGMGYFMDFVKSRGNKSPFAVQENKGFSDIKNGAVLVPGTRVDLPDGTVLKWTRNGVDFIPRRTSLEGAGIAAEYAGRIAQTMAQFTRIANKETFGMGKIIGITREETKEIRRVLGAMGINTYGDFYVNGKKFTFDANSGKFKFDFENSADGKRKIRFVKANIIKLV